MSSVPPGYPLRGSYSPIVITGETGPFQPTNQAGNYGRNTHYNYMTAQNSALQHADRLELHASERANPLAQLSAATLRYSPETTTTKTELITNAFGYAQQDIKSVKSPHKQGDYLDSTDLTNAVGAQAAQNMMKAEDLNKDGVIDSKEHATFILFEDNPTTLMAGTLNAFAQNPGAIPGQDPAVLSEWAQQFANGTDSQLDGQMTGGERHIAEQAVQWSPNFVNVTLQEMYKTLDIPNVIDQGMTQSGGYQGPNNPFYR